MSDPVPAPLRRVPAIDGWFTIDAEPTLLGNRCTSCGTVFFPKASFFCRNPDCAGDEFTDAPLSRRGRIWSFTDAQYQPPPPYLPRAEPFRPFALAAVELDDEQMVVLGQVADGYTVADLEVGQPVELVVEELYSDDEHDYLVYKWKPVDERVDA
ncbi:MAG TPA: OB-fold domain-containing protein [Mycobacteriales bacterium]|nr:OB-fold domain-containing protein [Mycobacteriales bacterium]